MNWDDVFNMRRNAIYGMLSLVAKIVLGISILAFVFSLVMLMFKDVRPFGWAGLAYSVYSFFGSFFLEGFALLVKAAVTYLDEKEGVALDSNEEDME